MKRPSPFPPARSRTVLTPRPASSPNPAAVGWAPRKKPSSTLYRFWTLVPSTATAHSAGRDEISAAPTVEAAATQRNRTRAKTGRLFITRKYEPSGRVDSSFLDRDQGRTGSESPPKPSPAEPVVFL